LTETKVQGGFIGENEFFSTTGLNEAARQKYESEGWIRPETRSDGRKCYSTENVELAKLIKRYTANGLPGPEAYELALEGMASKKARATQGETYERGTIDPSGIETHPGFAGLLGIDPSLLKRITADMAANGYDESKPIILATWPGQDTRVLIDGHTRVQASEDVGITEIPYAYRHFDSQAAALEHAMGLQSKRRITTDGVIFRLIETYDSLMERGGDRRSEDAKSKRTDVGNEKGRSASAHRTAHMLGCNYKKVERARRIIKGGTPQVKEDVRKDKMTINKAYNLITSKGQAEDDKTAQEKLPKKISEAAKKLFNKKNMAGFKALGGNLVAHANAAAEMYLEFQKRAASGLQTSRVDDQKPVPSADPGAATDS